MKKRNNHLHDFSKYFPDIKFSKDSTKEIIHHWDNIKCINFPKVEEIRKIVISILGENYKKNLCDDLVTILYELITNAFRSQADYKIRSEIYSPEYFINENEFIITKECKKCTDVSILCYKLCDTNRLAFKISNKGKIHKHSINRIKTILGSDNISTFPNFFTTETEYNSFTGVSGIGLFTLKNIITNDYNSNIIFDIKENEISFLFVI